MPTAFGKQGTRHDARPRASLITFASYPHHPPAPLRRHALPRTQRLLPEDIREKRATALCNSNLFAESATNRLCSQVYLDERHLDWMNDQILQHVLADLRPQCVLMSVSNSL